MSEANESKPRPKAWRRWFQFDLRSLFVLITAVGVILAIEVARGRKSNRKLLETLTTGQPVRLSFSGDQITIIVGDSSPDATITEIGEDFLGFKWSGDGNEHFIPLHRLGGVSRSALPSAKTPPGLGPKKPPGLGPAKT